MEEWDGDIYRMFEVGGTYANRKGEYKVLELHDSKMTVEYQDGTTAELNVKIQHRIWENIQAETEIKQSRYARTKGASGLLGTKFFIRPVSSLIADQLAVRGLKEHVLEQDVSKHKISKGDRLIYFAIENQVFFAVVTITGEPAKPTSRDRLTEQQTDASVYLFPVDVDARALKVENAVPVDGIEIESQPDILQLLNNDDTYIPITEDEFEVLAELLTEASEEEDDVDDEDDLDDEDDFDV
jgi:hypothetical protein